MKPEVTDTCEKCGKQVWGWTEKQVKRMLEVHGLSCKEDNEMEVKDDISRR